MIPIFTVKGLNIPYVWEQSLISLYNYGIEIPTQYDKEGDPLSKDCTMLMVVDQPLSEPMIHRDMPGGLSDLQEYVMEVCDGIKDHCVRNPNNPDDYRWEYTYHQRLFNYSYGSMEYGFRIDQIENMCQQLAKCPYTRRAQAVTWDVFEDNKCYDPPCLQSIWCRIINNELCMNVRFRSRDAYKAAFMNMFALIMLQSKIVDRVNELTGQKYTVGRYADISDSYHIYGKDIKEFENRFVANLTKRNFTQRTMQYSDVGNMMQEYIPSIKKKMLTFGK